MLLDLLVFDVTVPVVSIFRLEVQGSVASARRRVQAFVELVLRSDELHSIQRELVTICVLGYQRAHVLGVIFAFLVA